MGKDVIKKSKAAGEVGLVEVTQLSSMGVRTRAKTQALQLQGLLHQNSAAEGSYLQLRNRRLQKPPNFSSRTKRNPASTKPNASKLTSRKSCASNSKVIGPLNSRSNIGPANSFNCLGTQAQSKVESVTKAEAAEQRNINLHVAASSSSLGENVLEFEACTSRFRDRSRTMERTPSSSSSSTTRRRSRLMPTSNEMDRFFLGPEQQQQIRFIEKYNFDPVNDKPLPGHFEWTKLHPK